MKQLRAGHLRILFAFDPNQQALLLLGGTKTGQWERRYDATVPKADALLDDQWAKIHQEIPREARDAANVQRNRRSNRGTS